MTASKHFQFRVEKLGRPKLEQNRKTHHFIWIHFLIQGKNPFSCEKEATNNHFYHFNHWLLIIWRRIILMCRPSSIQTFNRKQWSGNAKSNNRGNLHKSILSAEARWRTWLMPLYHSDLEMIFFLMNWQLVPQKSVYCSRVWSHFIQSKKIRQEWSLSPNSYSYTLYVHWNHFISLDFAM